MCGRITGYELGVPSAFRGSSHSIDTYYVEGVSVTHGSPRQHIWTFTGGHDEQGSYPAERCPVSQEVLMGILFPHL